uniref:Protein HIRA n=1 Tax=Triatoma dimidiata TaxID=72491 RepID=A0A0V0GBI1_TRIDM
MRVVKPDWINHNGMAIYSIDIHPDGSRVATGGQGDNSGGRIVIWNMAPVTSEKCENNESVPKMLCQLDNHLACVNCVRWSGSGKYLASGGDDKLVMIWTVSKSLGGNSVFGSKGKVNVEGWRCVYTLRAHQGDVLDIAWSPGDIWLATCSVDNTVIIWRADNFPEIISVLKGHTGLVKGVSWDPVGKYLGSQSDDKTVRIWRTSDWSLEKVIKKPFEKCSGTTMVLRLSWSPDGQHLVTAHAMNGTGPTAQIIERDGWDHSKDIVGHHKAVTCVRYSPAIIEAILRGGKPTFYCLCAVGSRDRSVSVWTTCAKRPLAVMKELFLSPVLDLGWTPSGSALMACSGDGTTAYLEFDRSELGRPLSDIEKNQILENLYGKVTVGGGHELMVIENPEILLPPPAEKSDPLHITQKSAQKQSQKNESMPHREEPNIHQRISENKEEPKRNGLPQERRSSQQQSPLSSPTCQGTKNSSNPQQSVTNSTSKSTEQIQQQQQNPPANRAAKQIETRTSDGRRRITPIFIPLDHDNNDEITPFGSESKPSFSSCGTKSRIVVERREDVVVTPNVTPAKSCSTPTSGGGSSNTTPAKASATSTPLLNSSPATAPKTEELATNNSRGGFTSLVTSVGKHESKRLLLKRHRASGIASGSPAASGTNVKKARRQEVGATATATVPAAPSELLNLLPPLTVNTENVIKLSRSKCTVNIENGASKGAQGYMSVVRLMAPNDKKPVWEVVLGSDVNGCVGTNEVVVLTCTDRTLRLINTISGELLMAPIALSGLAALLRLSNGHLVCATTTGRMTVWPLPTSSSSQACHTSALIDKSLVPLLPSQGDLRIKECIVTDIGEPLVALTCGKAFLYSLSHNSWLLMGNSNDPVLRNTHYSYRSSLKSSSANESLPLKSIQAATLNGVVTGGGRVIGGSDLGPLCTLSFLDGQIASAKALNSKQEFKFWYLTLVRYLVQQGLEARLRNMCEDLLGPIYSGVNNPLSNWNSHIMEFPKHTLLREVLREMLPNLKLQRLYTEIKDQLDILQSS